MGGLFALLLAGPASAGRPVSAEGTQPDAYQAIAAADGFRISVSAPGLSVVNTLFDLAGPTAQAMADGLGRSIGYAAYPDPGELVITGPGLVAGGTGGAFSFPPYPLGVQTTWPAAPDGAVGEGPYEVEAHSRAAETTARAESGHGDDPASRARSTAEAALDGRTVVARATSTVESLAIGPLTIASSVATATATVAPGEAPKLTTDLVVRGAEIDGTPIGFSPAGLTLAGSTIPLPAGHPASKSLEAAGIAVTYLAPRTEGSTARSAGVQIVVRQVLEEGVPGAVPAGQVVEYRIVLGQAMASASATGALALPAGGAALSEPDTAAPAAAAADPAPAVAGDGSASPRPAAEAEAASTAVAGTAAVGEHGGSAIAAAATAVVPRLDTLDFYWVLAVGAVAAAAALHLNRTGRQRRRWLHVKEQHDA